MKVSAPGKLVVSGEYAVLEGAPAVVTAVSTRAMAQSLQNRAHPTAPEINAALNLARDLVAIPKQLLRRITAESQSRDFAAKDLDDVEFRAEAPHEGLGDQQRPCEQQKRAWTPQAVLGAKAKQGRQGLAHGDLCQRLITDLAEQGRQIRLQRAPVSIVASEPELPILISNGPHVAPHYGIEDPR